MAAVKAEGAKSSGEDLVVWSASSIRPSERSASEMIKGLLQEKFSATLKVMLVRQIEDKDFYPRFHQLKDGLIDLLEVAKMYSFKGLDMNGFSTFVDFFVDFLDFILKEKYFDKVQSTDDVTQVIFIFESLLKIMINSHKERFEGKKTLNKMLDSQATGLLGSDYKEVDTVFNARESLEEQFDTLFEKFLVFWMTKPSRKLFLQTCRTIVFAVKRFPSCFKIVSPTFVGRSLRVITKNASYETPLQAISVVDTCIGRKICNLMSYNSKVKARGFRVPAQGRWIIPDQGLEILENNPPVSLSHSISCRLVSHATVPNSRKVLIFHCHGGGLAILGSDFHETYSKDFVAELEGAALICPDYTMKAAYPLQFQEILDVYLWICSNDPSVENELGFRPEKVVLMGDSAGGILGLGLLHVLDIIQRVDSTSAILFPKDLIFFYGGFLLHSPCSPSRMSSFFDILLSEGVCMAMGGMVAGIEGHEGRREFSNYRLIRFFQRLKDDLYKLSFLISSSIRKPWYLNDGHFDLVAIKTLMKKLENTFLQSFVKLDYDRFVDTKLYLFTTSKCVFLDDNIDLARLWKGYVELHVVKGQVHGFLAIPGETRAFQYGLSLLKKAVKNGEEG